MRSGTILRMPLRDWKKAERELESVFTHVVYSIHTKYALVLAEYDGKESGLAGILSENQLLRDLKYRISVSDAFRGTENLPRYHQQVLHAADFMKKVFPDRNVLAYDAIRRLDGLRRCMDTGTVPLFVRETEQQLYRYDLQHSTEYFRTLFIYLKHSRSLQETADEMHIHKNTVSYRISKIREIVDVDLNDADVRVGFYLAYLTSQLMDVRENGKMTDPSSLLN